jgi:hypothetical protein
VKPRRGLISKSHEANETKRGGEIPERVPSLEEESPTSKSHEANETKRESEGILKE